MARTFLLSYNGLAGSASGSKEEAIKAATRQQCGTRMLSAKEPFPGREP